VLGGEEMATGEEVVVHVAEWLEELLGVCRT